MKANNFSLIENMCRIDNVYTIYINPKIISILRQSRSSLSKKGIEDLVSSFKIKGQKTPGDIYAFTKSDAIYYIKEMNILWNTHSKIEDFSSFYIKEKKDFYYLFLVAGHRRLQASLILKVDYIANIHFGKNFEEAIEWQLAENIQREELSLLDLITSATNYWVRLKNRNPKLTLKTYAEKHIGKSVSWLSNALRFSRLPLSVQDLIRKTEINKGVNFSILLEFAKLYDFSLEKEKPLKEEDLMAYINHVISHKYSLQKVKDFCEIRKDELMGQQYFFELSIEEINKNSLSAIRRNRTLHVKEAKNYLDKVGVVANEITNNCERIAKEVIELGKTLEEKLNK